LIRLNAESHSCKTRDFDEKLHHFCIEKSCILHDVFSAEGTEVIIPPPKNAVAGPQSTLGPSVRDRHIAEIETCGRLAWQNSTGYNHRSLVEPQMGRWKAVIGPKLKARNFANQKTEAKIGVRVLNRMTVLGRPEFEHVA
jgi:hypothetical protein